MSTKVPEKCPQCKTDTLPETAYPFIEQYSTAFEQWKYQCPKCDAVWANEAQRALNAQAFHRALSKRQGIYV